MVLTPTAMMLDDNTAGVGEPAGSKRAEPILVGGCALETEAGHGRYRWEPALKRGRHQLVYASPVHGHVHVAVD